MTACAPKRVAAAAWCGWRATTVIALEYGAAIEIDDPVEVHESGAVLWLMVDGTVRARATMS